jgi:hypothetical protein
VCHNMYHLGPEVISHEAKQTLLYAAYLPYAVLRQYSQHRFVWRLLILA